MKKTINPFLFIFMPLFLLITGCTTETGSTPPPTLSFAVTGEFHPFHFEDGDKLVGFDVEIGEEIAKRLGMEPKPIKADKDSLFAELKNGKYHAVISSLSITPERLKEFTFSQPYYKTGAQWFTLEGNKEISSVDMLKGKRLGVVQGTTYANLAKSYTDKPQLYTTYVKMLQELNAGKIDAVMMDRMMGFVAEKEEGLAIKPVGDLLYTDEVGIAVNPGNSELLSKINQALNDMNNDGTYEKLALKWLGNALK